MLKLLIEEGMFILLKTNELSKIMNTTQSSNLMETVFAIIDSRVQFIEYEQNSSLKDYKDNPPGEANKLLTEATVFNHTLSSRMDKMIEEIEYFSKHLRRLTILRSHLNTNNAKFILGLLTNNHYLDFSVENLTKKLQRNSYMVA